MKMVRTSAAGLAATAVLAGATVVGCDKFPSATSTAPAGSGASLSAGASPKTSAAASRAAPQPDYSPLLIKPGDIGSNATADGPPTPTNDGMLGVTQAFKNGDYSVGDIIYVLPDPSAAAQMFPEMKDKLQRKINAAPQPIDVGSNGLVGRGIWSDMSSGLSEVVFTEGRAFVLLDFYSSPNNLTPPDVVLDLARKQDAAIKNGLPR
jgi:hypothetical protein